LIELLVANGIRTGTVFFLEGEAATLGRSSECDIVIPDGWISARHALLEVRGDRVWIVDLESRNGTFVNDRRVREAPLRPGDRVALGQTLADVRPGARASIPAQATAFRYLADVQRRVGIAPGGAGVEEGGPAGPVAGSQRQVAVLNAIGRALADASELDESLGKILRTLAAAVEAEGSALLLTDEHGRMIVRASEPAGAGAHVSTTIVEAATRSRAGLLVLDAQSDARFQHSQSVMLHAIRSTLCVPIWAENRMLGALVLDRRVVRPFTTEDLDLVTVVAYQAALAIERAHYVERMRMAESQRRRLLRHFSHDVANLIMSDDGSGPDPLGACVRDDVTILFSDVCGFTGLTEQLPALELAELLRAYFKEMTNEVFEQRGTLDKFIGDGLMAIFGAPVPQPDAAVRAVRCALGMQARVAELNRRLPADRQLAIRIGVNTGRVVSGSFGSAERVEFTVLGDTVNVAARLESSAEPGTVYVGRDTFEATRGTFTYRQLGSRTVKGRRAPVEVFQALGPAAARR
jgi:adenylate cyclase